MSGDRPGCERYHFRLQLETDVTEYSYNQNKDHLIL